MLWREMVYGFFIIVKQDLLQSFAVIIASIKVYAKSLIKYSILQRTFGVHAKILVKKLLKT